MSEQNQPTVYNLENRRYLTIIETQRFLISSLQPLCQRPQINQIQIHKNNMLCWTIYFEFNFKPLKKHLAFKIS